MKVSKVCHNNIDRIKVEFGYNKNIENILRNIPDTRWSKTLKAWHIPYTKDAYKQLTELFPEIVMQPSVCKPSPAPAAIVDIPPKTPAVIGLEISGRKIILRMPKNDADIKFVRSLRFSTWKQVGYYWLIPNYPEHLEMIKNYFGLRLSAITEVPDLSISPKGDTYNINKDEVLVIKTASGRLKLIFGYVTELQAYLRKIPYHVWDSKNHWWTIPYSEVFFNGIKECIEACNLKLLYEEEQAKPKGKPRITAFDIPNYRKCPEEYLTKLKELRYSENTLKTYTNAFEEFINYYFRFDIKQLDEPQVIAFLRYLVTERKVSQSYQNQVINAIKFYYERVLGGQRKFYFIERPGKEKTLPIVLSMEEVTNIIYHTSNIKHKAMLMITYSAGLRVSEVINLKITDIDSRRKQIRIVQSKGKRDLYTLLSPKALSVLREYFKIYKPEIWLFEGNAKQQYSVRSLQEVLSDSVKKANIKKKVSMHTLRHSFATHLLENGTSLRYIQSLLGHSNSKTTEIYTHITTKGFDQIRSPLDCLDI